MSKNDRLMLWGAAAVMIAVGALSLWKVSRMPAIDPEIAKLQTEYGKIWNGRPTSEPPAQVADPRVDFSRIIPEPARPHEWTAFIHTKYVGHPEPRPRKDVYVLSLPKPKSASSTLDETTLTWSLVEPVVELDYWMVRKEIKPTGFLIRRQAEDGRIEEIAEVGPKVASYTDLTVRPRTAYRYWVSAKGKESDRTVYPPTMKDVVNGLDESVQTRTPSDTRAKLVGGAKDNAFVRIDTYDRSTKKWVGKTAMVVPGQKMGGSGWTLRGLRFDNFTLVAEVTDDEGVDRILTTKD